MNRHGLRVLVVSVLAVSVAACADTGQIQRELAPPDDPVIGLLSKGITQLNVNINMVSKRMNDVRQASAGTDSALQELQALDLSGWELQQRQWIVQRNHLVLTRDTLQRVQLSQEEDRKSTRLNSSHQR